MAKRRRTFLIVGAGALGLLLAAWLVAGLLLEAHRIPSQSMAPTINPGDRVLARSIAGGDAARGDVIIYGRPELGDAGSEYIARVVAVGGDRIADDEGHLSVNGRRADESYLKTDRATPGIPTLVVPDDHLFVMGDNRSNSSDSRVFGPVPTRNVRGRVVFRWSPLAELGRI